MNKTNGENYEYLSKGLGYGVVLTGGGDGNVTVIVENNRFDYNRHTVAGSGERGT